MKIPRFATIAQVLRGTSTSTIVTPAGLSEALANTQENYGTLCPHENLRVQTNDTNNNTQVDVDADALVLTDSGGLRRRVTNVSVTADITASGANGLDTGSEASGTWYHVWVIYDGSTVAALLSTSSTRSGLTLPSGYTYSGYVGACFNNSSSNLIDFEQVDREVVISAQFDLDGGTATSFTAVSITVPSTARRWFGMATCKISGTGNAGVEIAAKSNGLGRVQYHWGDITFGVSGVNMALIESQTVYYFLQNGNEIELRTSGWSF